MRASLALAAAAALSIPGTALSAESSTAEPTVPGVPLYGQMSSVGVNPTGSPSVISVHGVHRVEGGTIVYYSIGFPEGADLGGETPAYALSQTLGGNINLYLQGRDAGRHCDVAVIDQAGGWMYAPMPRAQYTPYGDLCSAEPYGEVGEARVAAVALAPLPDGVDRVDVSIRGTLFPDVPVAEGMLEPAAEPDDRRGPLVGTGWPVLNEEAIAASDPSDRIYPVTQGIQDVAGEITESQSTLELSGDVLFAFGSADIDPAGHAVIERAVEEIRARGVTGTLLVNGHTDNNGSEGRNDELSRQRAESVADVLRTTFGADLTIETVGRGQREPIASNDTEAGQALNRRVTLEFTNGNV